MTIQSPTPHSMKTFWVFTLLLPLLFFSAEDQALASQNHSVGDFDNMPTSIVEEGVAPRVVINTSNDHQLYFKAYNDYSDLNNDNIPETTYDHSISYYGYFDAFKCYEYNTDLTDPSDTTSPRVNRFEPVSINTDKYCNAGGSSNQWSGNFLNWVSMARIDTIRKVLYGGHRRVDTNTETVLERTFLPHDAHSWAKYYKGSDIPQLTPFTRADYDCDSGNLTDSKCEDSGGDFDERKVGITFGNTTDVDMDDYGNNTFSEEYEEPPLIKVVKGNYSLWASNERWQITWAEDSNIPDSHNATNANDPDNSEIHAFGSNPEWSARLGEGNYVARVQVCVDTLIGQEKCKLYPDGNYKPTGLLQSYGDDDKMQFGMVAGSYNQHASGGVLIRNVGSLTDEVNVTTDGTFPKVAEYAGGPEANNQAEGLINAWSLYRLIGYDNDEGHYNSNQGDNCTWGLSDFSTVTAANRCRNWGNPFSEIYYQSINYLAGAGVIGDYRDNSSNVIPGLPTPQPFVDPLDDDSYCADLFVINLNSSSSSYDYDELDGVSYGPSRIWDPAILPGDKSSSAMTDAVGIAEEIHNNYYFIGEKDLGSGTDDQLCTSKEITSLGEAGGVCPESPRLTGSYRIAGLAYYAHTQDIRPDNATGNRDLESTQTVDTYSVAMASGVPAIRIPNPEDLTGEPLVTILPACRNTGITPSGNCALVDFKIVSQEIDPTAKTAKGTFYINWEDSEQGGDFDQDMWGTLNYTLNLTNNTVSITTDVHAKSTPYKMGFGYVVSGTQDGDGFHVHSGINDFTLTPTTPEAAGNNSCETACADGDAATTNTYTLGTSTTKLLEDPLWYAAKYGGFIDSNDNKLPDLQSEWDSQINSSGDSGQDGIPDNFFFATNPQELEDSLTRVLNAILERTSSGTAAAVVSSNVRGEGAVFQAYYEPKRKDTTQEASWIGTLQALWLDSYGLSRQDCTPPANNAVNTNGQCEALTGPCIPNNQLDNYCVDQVVETYFDDLAGRTRMRIYESGDPDEFSAYSMQGVVESYTSGAVTLAPYTFEGGTTFTGSIITLTPYEVRGTITAFDDTTGVVTMDVAASDWTGPDGQNFDIWSVTSSAGLATGVSSSSISLTTGSATFTVSPLGPWLAVDDTVTLKTKNIVGASGQVFENWDVTCLEGGTIPTMGSISQGHIQINNREEVVANITTDAGDFSTCTRAQFASYNVKGTPGETYNSWLVSNIKTNLGRGTSPTSLTLQNSGTLSFSVVPTDNWLTAGDEALVANYTTTSKELYEISYLWNAREELYFPSGLIDLTSNRDYENADADEGRFITTWIDSNLNNKVDAGEYLPFETSLFAAPQSKSYTFFDVNDQTEAENLINYVRGAEQVGSRNRTIQYSPTDTQVNVMRLGDIINSTPVSVGSPQEAFDLLYFDTSYREFRQKYINRRIVIYAGANDGMIHAFNGGFYNIGTDVNGDPIVEYSTTGFKNDGTTPARPHPLGSEIWAYAPMNLLSHLQWLKPATYSTTHVSFMDAKPRVFDAKIFPTNGDHPNGWGTVMVIGMNLGGGEMSLTVDHDNDNNVTTPGEDITRRSAYVVFDITNPEIEPQLIAEFTIPDGSFTTVYPAVVTFQDVGNAKTCNSNNDACNRWYLMFGSGPDDLDTYESSKTAKAYLLDLNELVSGTSTFTAGLPAASYPTGCTVLDPTIANPVSPYNILQCDTGITNTFMGTPSVVDWELNFKANTAYFGLVGDKNSTKGSIMRFGFDDKPDFSDWDPISTLYNTNRPVSAQIAPSLDNLGNHWVFFGTGRYFSLADKTNTENQGLFGIKDPDDNSTLATSSLLNVTNAEVYTDGTLKTNVTAVDGTTLLTTFDQIHGEIDTNANGWFLTLPPILGSAGAVPSTRSVTRPALLGGVLFNTVFQPSEDPCSGEGRSRLYGMYYKTGTAFPSIPVFGTSIETVGTDTKYVAKRSLDLGQGMASSPTIHSGSGSGDSGIKVLTQLSTGELIETEAETVEKIRSGRTSWQDQ